MARERKLLAGVMVVGDNAVGKSSLIHCMRDGSSMRNQNLGPTIRFDSSVSIEHSQGNINLTMNFIDVAGEN